MWEEGGMNDFGLETTRERLVAVAEVWGYLSNAPDGFIERVAQALTLTERDPFGLTFPEIAAEVARVGCDATAWGVACANAQRAANEQGR
jgi:hypothetical protein